MVHTYIIYIYMYIPYIYIYINDHKCQIHQQMRSGLCFFEIGGPRIGYFARSLADRLFHWLNFRPAIKNGTFKLPQVQVYELLVVGPPFLWLCRGSSIVSHPPFHDVGLRSRQLQWACSGRDRAAG